MGLSFSVPKGARVPPSMKKIYKEIKNSIKFFIEHDHGDISGWAKQGVLLLNDVLTVTENLPFSHSNIGRKQFTSKILELINDNLTGVVFMVWGIT